MATNRACRGLPSFNTNGSLKVPGVKSMFERLSLQAKIIAIVGVTVMVVLGVSTLIATFLTRDPVESELYQKALAQARLTAHQIAASDTLARPDVLGAGLASTAARLCQASFRRMFTYMTSSSSGGHHEPARPAFGTRRHPRCGTVTGSICGRTKIRRVLKRRIGARGLSAPRSARKAEPIGCLILTVSRSSLNAVTWDLVLRNLLLMLASFVVVVLVIHFFFLRAVRRPVKEMIRVMESAEGGQLNVRARLQSWDEIGLLAAHLNRMLRRIENFSNETGPQSGGSHGRVGAPE